MMWQKNTITKKRTVFCFFASMGKNYAIKEIGIHRLSTAYPPDNDS